MMSSLECNTLPNIGVIVVDLQADFTTLKQGALAVADTGQDYVDAVQSAVNVLKSRGGKIFATQDWHPKNHVSFYSAAKGEKPYDEILIDGRAQILWPPHCVQHTENAEILIDNDVFIAVVRKGTNPDYDSYSGFKDDGGEETRLHPLLKSHGITTVVIFGLATDYCVKATALDAVTAGYTVIVVKSLCRGVAADTTRAALAEMRKNGINIFDKLDLKNLTALLKP